jgi:hypothetical protein
MEPLKEIVGGIGSVVDKHVDRAQILELLGRIAELDAVTQRIHGVEKGGGLCRARGRLTTGALTRTDTAASSEKYIVTPVRRRQRARNEASSR